MNGVELGFEGVRRLYAAGGAEEVRALDGVDLTIDAGAFVSVEGPSGCGKTTLLQIAGLIDTPSAGRVVWDRQDVSRLSDAERSRRRLTGVGFIFQRFYLLPTLTAQENVELPLRARRVRAGPRRARAVALLEEVGLGPTARSYPHELSGGEEQRVAIARALANEPGLILADEPTGELDSTNTARVLDLLEGIHRRHGSTLLLVTHNPLVAGRASRHLTMRDGRIVGDTREA